MEAHAPGSNGVHRPAPTPPRFGVPEAALIILATLLGLALDWAFRLRGVAGHFADLARLPNDPTPGLRAAHILHNAALALAPLAAAWTLATLASIDGALRPWKRLFHRPGLTPGLAIVPALLVAAGFAWPDRHAGWPAIATGFRLHAINAMAALIAFWWMVLLRGRRWHPETTWADRLGLFLGIYWIAAFAAIQGFKMISSR
ncbi:hypothetical protein TA3x_002063 [Tundrisphaera sp. TA3]|uniref:hypothetical protein n=1 Tax=Tundrisphaera sp. TA3 TaxID=3435775 RepID=UPI003EC00E07